jgi:hypothetical protein
MDGRRAILVFFAMTGSLLALLAFGGLPVVVTGIALPLAGAIGLVSIARSEDRYYREYAGLLSRRLRLWCGLGAVALAVLSLGRMGLIPLADYIERWLEGVRLLTLGLLCDYTWAGQRLLAAKGRYRGVPTGTLAVVAGMVDILLELGFVVGLLVALPLQRVAWPKRDAPTQTA